MDYSDQSSNPTACQLSVLWTRELKSIDSIYVIWLKWDASKHVDYGEMIFIDCTHYAKKVILLETLKNVVLKEICR